MSTILLNKELLPVFNRSIEIIKEDMRCLGGWHFGSVGRGLHDELSDVDPVFLIKEEYFEEFAEDIPKIFDRICGNVILIVPEDFNADGIKNYAILLEANHTIQLYDIFLLNEARLADPMCRMHYRGCTEENIIFDRNGVVKALLKDPVFDNTPQRNVSRLIDKYLLYMDISIKYYKRNDVFQMISTMQTLFYIHMDLLLSEYQKTDWGGWPSLIKHNIPVQKQNPLFGYFCKAETKELRGAIEACSEAFFSHADEICRSKGIGYERKKIDRVVSYFKKNG